MNKKDITTSVCFTTVIIALGVISFHAWIIRFSNADYFEETYLTGIEITSGRIESPSVIIEVSREEFLQLVSNQTNPVVYRQNAEFYIFNDEMTIAYNFQTPTTCIWETRNW
jgi:hypothetical protein